MERQDFGNNTVCTLMRAEDGKNINCVWYVPNSQKELAEKKLSNSDKKSLSRLASIINSGGHNLIESLPLLRTELKDYVKRNVTYIEIGEYLKKDDTQKKNGTPAFEHLDWWNHLTEEDALQATLGSLQTTAANGITLLDMLVIKGMEKTIPKKVRDEAHTHLFGEIHIHMDPQNHRTIPGKKGVFHTNNGQFISRSFFHAPGDNKLAEYTNLTQQERIKAAISPLTCETIIKVLCQPSDPKKGLTLKQTSLLKEVMQADRKVHVQEDIKEKISHNIQKYLNPKNIGTNPKVHQNLHHLPYQALAGAGFSPMNREEWEILFESYIADYQKKPTLLKLLAEEVTGPIEDVLTIEKWYKIANEFLTGPATKKNSMTLLDEPFLGISLRYLEEGLEKGYINIPSSLRYRNNPRSWKEEAGSLLRSLSINKNIQPKLLQLYTEGKLEGNLLELVINKTSTLI